MWDFSLQQVYSYNKLNKLLHVWRQVPKIDAYICQQVAYGRVRFNSSSVLRVSVPVAVGPYVALLGSACYGLLLVAYIHSVR